MNQAACTIVSMNYLAYAKTLCHSYLQFHPESKFYILLVDRAPVGFDFSREPFEVIFVEDLGIPNFQAVSFKYGILELNTSVKPTFLKRILDTGIEGLIYFDPDILVCAPVDPIYQELATHGILLTPHCMSPNIEAPYDEVLLLINGVFNLGFVAVSNSVEGRSFLDWWEERCLNLAYSERWTGLFVDQKWINLAPCYFNSLKISKKPGYNMAYWNLHERFLSKTQGSWIVNDSEPLLFFHFSGISVDGGYRISKHSDQFDLKSRPELVELFKDYRDSLASNGIEDFRDHKYAFGYFDDCTPINKLQRAAFAANLETFGSTNPFDPQAPFYQWAKRRGLQSHKDSVGEFGRKAYQKSDRRVRLINTALRWSLLVLGADRYSILMKYLEFASVLRNQKDILGDIKR